MSRPCVQYLPSKTQVSRNTALEESIPPKYDFYIGRDHGRIKARVSATHCSARWLQLASQ